MKPDDIRLKAACLIRKAGLSAVPLRVLVCVGVALAVLVAIALVRFWPQGTVEDSYGFSVEQAGADATADARDGTDAAKSGEVAGSADSAEAASPGGQPGADDAKGEASDVVKVDVEGAVKKPGLYTLPAGARVGDAVEAAGGMRKTAAHGSVNLAQLLEDGEQIHVPTRKELKAQAANADGSAAAASTLSTGSVDAADAGKVNLNTATLEQLQSLSGIGPVLAANIVEYREQNGGFSSVEELENVSGIGQARYASLKDSVCV